MVVGVTVRIRDCQVNQLTCRVIVCRVKGKAREVIVSEKKKSSLVLRSKTEGRFQLIPYGRTYMEEEFAIRLSYKVYTRKI